MEREERVGRREDRRAKRRVLKGEEERDDGRRSEKDEGRACKNDVDLWCSITDLILYAILFTIVG